MVMSMQELKNLAILSFRPVKFWGERMTFFETKINVEAYAFLYSFLYTSAIETQY